MKIIKWKILIITCIICLLPMLLGVVMWDDIPATLAIHFNMNFEPDNFASKTFVVFGLPLMMMAFQSACCVISDFSFYKQGENKKIERVTKWIIPIMTVLLYVITLGYSLGWNVDIRKSIVMIIGCMLIVLGNYIPKLNYVKNMKCTTDKARKINRFTGFATVVMGLLFLLSLFFNPIVSVVCVCLLIPYAIICLIYSMVVIKRK